MSIGNTNLHQRGEIPEIVKLPNGRIRVIRRFHKFTREDVDNANLGSLMGDFGDLDTTGEQITNQGYTDCRLISVEVDTRFNSVSNTDSAVLVKTYETLTDSFVQITDDTVTFTDNGLKQITRVYRAISGTTSSNVVGVTALGTGEILASSRIEDNDAFAELTETYIEAGILSRTEDFVGSQDSLVIEAIGPDPSTPSGFSLASKQESNYNGFQTNRFTFLKDDVQLSQTEDKVGSQLAISQQWFNPSADKTLAGYSLASKNISDFEGIETVEYRFLKPSVLSRSIQTRNNGKLIIETVEAFNEVPTANTVGAVQIGDEVSDVEGIPTRRYTFAKGEGQISVDRKPAESSLAGCTYVTVRSLGTPVTPSGVLVAESETESDGYITYEKTALQGTITGVKQTYKDVVEVEVPGTVELIQQSTAISDSDTVNLSGTIAIPKIVPPRRKKIAATVTVEITNSPPNTASLAFDLGEISCSVTSLSETYSSKHGPTKRSKVGIFITQYTDWSRTYNAGARVQVYDGCYLTTGDAYGSVAYQSGKYHILNPDEDEDGYGDGLDSTVNSNAVSNTKCIGAGSTSQTGYSTTGIIQRNSRPILTSLNGDTYYEVITWSA